MSSPEKSDCDAKAWGEEPKEEDQKSNVGYVQSSHQLHCSLVPSSAGRRPEASQTVSSIFSLPVATADKDSTTMKDFWHDDRDYRTTQMLRGMQAEKKVRKAGHARILKEAYAHDRELAKQATVEIRAEDASQGEDIRGRSRLRVTVHPSEAVAAIALALAPNLEPQGDEQTDIEAAHPQHVSHETYSERVESLRKARRVLGIDEATLGYRLPEYVGPRSYGPTGESTSTEGFFGPPSGLPSREPSSGTPPPAVARPVSRVCPPPPKKPGFQDVFDEASGEVVRARGGQDLPNDLDIRLEDVHFFHSPQTGPTPQLTPDRPIERRHTEIKGCTPYAAAFSDAEEDDGLPREDWEPTTSPGILRNPNHRNHRTVICELSKPVIACAEEASGKQLGPRAYRQPPCQAPQ